MTYIYLYNNIYLGEVCAKGANNMFSPAHPRVLFCIYLKSDNAGSDDPTFDARKCSYVYNVSSGKRYIHNYVCMNGFLPYINRVT